MLSIGFCSLAVVVHMKSYTRGCAFWSKSMMSSLGCKIASKHGIDKEGNKSAFSFTGPQQELAGSWLSI